MIVETATPAFDVRRGPGRRRAGSLREFNEAGVLSPPTSTSRSARPARRRRADEAVPLGAAFAARAPRLGHVCVDLATIRHHGQQRHRHCRPTSMHCRGPIPEAWLDGTDRRAPSSGEAPPPAVRVDPLSDRLWLDERQVAADLLARAGRDVVDIDLDAPARRVGTALVRPEDGGSRPPTVGRCSRRTAARLGHRRRARDGEDDDCGPAVGAAR